MSTAGSKPTTPSRSSARTGARSRRVSPGCRGTPCARSRGAERATFPRASRTRSSIATTWSSSRDSGRHEGRYPQGALARARAVRHTTDPATTPVLSHDPRRRPTGGGPPFWGASNGRRGAGDGSGVGRPRRGGRLRQRQRLRRAGARPRCPPEFAPPQRGAIPELDQSVKVYTRPHVRAVRRPMRVVELGRRARHASRKLASASAAEKDAALLTAADLLVGRTPEILAANADDTERAAADGMEAGPLDRLRL